MGRSNTILIVQDEPAQVLDVAEVLYQFIEPIVLDVDLFLDTDFPDHAGAICDAGNPDLNPSTFYPESVFKPP